jgi:hypothetical protein
LRHKGLQITVDVEDEINELQKNIHVPIIPGTSTPADTLKSGSDL